jgi:DNA-directed RNA polymerase subunit RPC12/RpoP
MATCENCGCEHNGEYGSGRFCSIKCSRGFSTKAKRSLINEQVSKKLKKIKALYNYKCETCGTDFESYKIRNGRKIVCDKCKRYVDHSKIISSVSSILELSSRTVRKILKRAKSSCVICGWDKTSLDIHHIHGKKIDECDNHKNLVCLCPNCHRLAHEEKINKKVLEEKSLFYYLKNWKDFYHISN